MDGFLLTARLVLAGVFALAALAKLVDRPGARTALREFGVPAALAAPVGGGLPLAELAVAAALVPLPSAWFGAVGALVLLLVFVVAIGINLALGRTPTCHCFGQLASAPAGWATLARNAVLAGAAGFIVWRGPMHVGASAMSWVGALSAPQRLGVAGAVLVSVVLALETWFLWQLVRQQGRLLLRLDAIEARLAVPGSAIPAAPVAAAGLPVGVPAPGFRLKGLHGETLTLDALRADGKPVLLVFGHPDCGPCQALFPDIAHWQGAYAATLTVAVLSEGSSRANRDKGAQHGLTRILLQKKREVAEAYHASGTPAAVLVRSDGTVGSPLALGADAIRALVAGLVGQSLPVVSSTVNGSSPQHAQPMIPLRAATASIGGPAPSLRRKDLNGKTVDLSSFKGSQTLVLFWNPDCGFCQQMLPDLKAWEAARPPQAPKLLVVSTGTIEQNRALGLRAPVVLDHNLEVGLAFGASGTPMAVLVDAEGRIASPVAAGATAVLALAGGQTEPNRA